MLTSEIISIFELYLDDTTELSSAEELSLANRIYKKICRARPWEFLKKEASGSIVNGVITLPTDFAFLVDNGNLDTGYKVIYVGTNKDPYKIVNYSERNQHIGQSNVAYVDLGASQIITMLPVNSTYTFDYIKIPADLTLATSPVFPIAHEIIAWGMAVDGYIIQQFPKANSYLGENQAKYNSDLADLAYYNSQLIL